MQRGVDLGGVLTGTVSTAPFFGSVEGEEVASSLGGCAPVQPLLFALFPRNGFGDTSRLLTRGGRACVLWGHQRALTRARARP
jgi:hypothetical protein